MTEERKNLILDHNQSQYFASFAELSLKNFVVQKYYFVLFFETDNTAADSI